MNFGPVSSMYYALLFFPGVLDQDEFLTLLVHNFDRTVGLNGKHSDISLFT